MATQSSEAAVLPRRSYVAHAWLTEPQYALLQYAAERRRQHPDQLTAMIMTAVIDGGYIDALMLEHK